MCYSASNRSRKWDFSRSYKNMPVAWVKLSSLEHRRHESLHETPLHLCCWPEAHGHMCCYLNDCNGSLLDWAKSVGMCFNMLKGYLWLLWCSEWDVGMQRSEGKCEGDFYSFDTCQDNLIFHIIAVIVIHVMRCPSSNPGINSSICGNRQNAYLV